uniref:Tyrosine-protein kinase catalytic domain-containing protein n=1 Tax=Oryza glaberrima TaxID=4538 RepID=I1QZF8_ORYGL
MAHKKPIRFTPRQLAGFTRGYSARLSAGGFGTVYGGALPNGLGVAVKVLCGGMGRRSEEQFMAEVGTIGRTHHINLVRLFGFCFDAAVRALVYEFMGDGALDAYLFDRTRAIGDSDGLRSPPSSSLWAEDGQVKLGTYLARLQKLARRSQVKLGTSTDTEMGMIQAKFPRQWAKKKKKQTKSCIQKLMQNSRFLRVANFDGLEIGKKLPSEEFIKQLSDLQFLSALTLRGTSYTVSQPIFDHGFHSLTELMVSAENLDRIEIHELALPKLKDLDVVGHGNDFHVEIHGHLVRGIKGKDEKPFKILHVKSRENNKNEDSMS